MRDRGSEASPSAVTLQEAGCAHDARLSHTWPKTPAWVAANVVAALAEQGSASTMPTVISIVKSVASPGAKYRVGEVSPSTSGVYIEVLPAKAGDPASLVT